MVLGFYRELRKIYDSSYLPLMNASHTFTLNALGPEITVAVKHSNKAKHLSIKVSHAGAALVLPRSALHKHLDIGYKFLLTKESWIRQKLQKMAEVYNTTYAIDHLQLPFFGKIYDLHYIEDTCSTPSCHINNECAVINVKSHPSEYYDTLVKFLRCNLLSSITTLINTLALKRNFTYSTIKIIDSKRGWGSCSSKGVIAFNWRLIFVPSEILEYVVIHELCHTVEMNHSKRFWYLVEQLYPDYRKARRWLKEHGPRLHQYLSL